MSNFQIIVLGVCAALILIGVGVFAAFGGVLGGSPVGAVTIWGTVKGDTMDNLLASLRSSDSTFQDVTYVEKSPGSYHAELLNAMAAGRAPDLFLIAHDELQPFTDKILIIPYGLVSQSSFLNSFIDESQIFLTAEGELALPFMVDPLVMYWNRDLFSSAGVANPPAYWNELLTIVPKVTSLDAGSNVRRSAVALGQWSNVAHAKEILSTLFMQAGDPVVVRGGEGLRAVFGTTPEGAPENPAQGALRFYTEFTNPTKTTYSWNKSLPLSTTAFVSGDLAMYFGFASEHAGLVALNPNLRFGVAVLPQIEGSGTKATFGRLVGIAISRGAANPGGAAEVAQRLAAKNSISELSLLTGQPPVRRDVRLDSSANAVASVFAESALIARGWPDPEPAATEQIFREMVESVISGSANTGEAVSQASRAFFNLTGI